LHLDAHVLLRFYVDPRDLPSFPTRRSSDLKEEQDDSRHLQGVERVFAILMIFTACSMAFAHGSNDVANAVGPLAAIVGVLQSGTIQPQSTVPGWVQIGRAHV